MVVRYFADIRTLARTDRGAELGFADSQRSPRRSGGRRGAACEKRVFEGGKLSDTIILLVNGRNIRHLNGVETALKPDDVVAVFP